MEVWLVRDGQKLAPSIIYGSNQVLVSICDFYRMKVSVKDIGKSGAQITWIILEKGRKEERKRVEKRKEKE